MITFGNQNVILFFLTELEDNSIAIFLIVDADNLFDMREKKLTKVSLRFLKTRILGN